MILHLSETDEDFDESEMVASSKRRPDVQFPEGRTFGECIEDEKRSIRMINGRFVPTIRIKDKPTRLKRSEALDYYKKKLQKVWENLPHEKYDGEISDNTPTISKEESLL
ncbi:hypothetical protein [Sulfuricurvum sp.]|uniref:hypothetical protein n=1 Tax=Sulfuricurvum sp. TaxID=2025608 RepID=UPI002604344F|nr:hypothetical protein [Sulfuricurvum sp.]MDD3596426.1 hypothetical protein [Sulfuricurvum sp.]MDD4950235.1 hypothetical protein [Sulfuricurvum sp.]